MREPAWVVRLVEAGVGAVQIRDESATDRTLVGYVRALVDQVRPLGAAVLVNDRVDLALAGGADGVHLGADDLPVRLARSLAPGLIIGATCRSRADVLSAQAQGASYAGVGPVFATTTKTGLPAPMGVAGLAGTTGTLPVLAVGGVGVDDVAALVGAGAHGVAVSGALGRAADPPTVAKELAAALALG